MKFYCPVDDINCPYYKVKTGECGLGLCACECDEWAYYNEVEDDEDDTEY